MKKMTEKEIRDYVDFVERKGRELPEENHRLFCAGACAIFFITNQAGEIPAHWIFLPLMGKSPFEAVEQKQGE